MSRSFAPPHAVPEVCNVPGKIGPVVDLQLRMQPAAARVVSLRRECEKLGKTLAGIGVPQQVGQRCTLAHQALDPIDTERGRALEICHRLLETLLETQQRGSSAEEGFCIVRKVLQCGLEAAESFRGSSQIEQCLPAVALRSGEIGL